MILIDHGWCFVFASQPTPSNSTLNAMIPNRKTYLIAKNLADNPELVDFPLKTLLSPRNLLGFKNRLNTFVHFVEKQIEKFGIEKVFEIPDREDWVNTV